MNKIFDYYDFRKKYILNEAIESDEGVDKFAEVRIRNVFKYILSSLPFFADFLFSLRIAEASARQGVRTMATDGKAILYNPAYVGKLPFEELTFVFIHEIMHNANMHFARQGNRKVIVQDQAGNKASLWNYATDYAINLQIKNMVSELSASNVKVPSTVLLDEKYADMSAEQIYDILLKQLPPPPPGGQKGQKGQQGGGQGQKGQGGGGQGQPDDGDDDGDGEGEGEGNEGEGGSRGVMPGELTPGDDVRQAGEFDGKGKTIYEGDEELGDAKTDDALAEKWREIRIKSHTKLAGSGSQSLARWIGKLIKPKVDWKNELKKFVKEVFDIKYDYRNYSKRFQYQNVFIPGIRMKDENTSVKQAVIAIDTSGSITDDLIGKFASELDSIFKTYKVKFCTLIWCDDAITSVQQFDTRNKFEIKKMKPKGGGGTSFIPPFVYIEKELIRKRQMPSFVIYFTDAYGTFPTRTQNSIQLYNQNVLWVITDNDDAKVPFGKAIYLDKDTR